MEPLQNVFVYGSLMRGEHHHAVLGRARFVANARTQAAFSLWLIDYYPALLAGGRQTVHGEIYAVDAATLDALDELEDVPALYERQRLCLAGGETADAYVLAPTRLPAAAVPIPSGDFRDVPAALRRPPNG